MFGPNEVLVGLYYTQFGLLLEDLVSGSFVC